MEKSDKTNFKQLFKNMQPCFYLEDQEEMLKHYFSKCFDDLVSRMQKKEKSSISRNVFSGYMNLAMVVSDRIFDAFNLNEMESLKENEQDEEEHEFERDFLDKIAFINGMFNLFFGPLEKLQKLTFSIMNVNVYENMNYNRDLHRNIKNKVIMEEDVKLLFTYLNNACGNMITNYEKIVTIFFQAKYDKNENEKIKILKNNENDKFENNEKISHNENIKNSKLTFEEYVEQLENKNSSIFTLILLLIYSKQPFTEDVIKFYREVYLDTHRKRRSSLEVLIDLKKEFISTPTEDILCYLNHPNSEYFSKPRPKRKSSTKNVLNFREYFMSLNQSDISILSEFIKNENMILTDEPSTSFSESSILISQDSSSECSTSGSSKSLISNLSCFKANVYQLKTTNMGKALKLIKLVIIDNNLFTLKLNPETNKYHIDRVHPLSGLYPTTCDDIKIQNHSFFPFAILSQHGNSFANVNNTFLTNSITNLNLIMTNLQTHMSYRNLDDHYEILNQIGSGVYGSVNLGLDKLTGEKVAIKIIGKNSIDSDSFEMVKNEIDIMNFLKNRHHSNIVTPLDIFEDKYFIYCIFEYMSGGTLESFFKEKKKLDESEVRSIVKQLADALSFINNFGIIHRDIKMDNVLLKNKDLSSVKLSDFGLSTIKFHNQKAKGSCGTLAYAAPELLTRLDYGKNVDIWSLGVLTYHLITGKFPYQGNGLKEIINQMNKRDLIFPNNANEEYSDDLILFIKNCMNKNPLERFDIDRVLMSSFIEG